MNRTYRWLGLVLNLAVPRSKHIYKPKRTSAVEVALPGLGWFSITAVDLDGTKRALDTIRDGSIAVYGMDGIDARPRSCIFPYELSGSVRSDWKVC